MENTEIEILEEISSENEEIKENVEDIEEIEENTESSEVFSSTVQDGTEQDITWDKIESFQCIQIFLLSAILGILVLNTFVKKWHV